ncbi:SCY1 protein kinase [Phakopsora pachyrhizi]|uniref:SCY1 protein kinase n=1 Tax=Phakopsora pachyrhizi TaxID=170000 RepID=A0AAV0AGT4_PHAPC|nr:SCY1 protein kinase [Phakopsora pachyrhizi]
MSWLSAIGGAASSLLSKGSGLPNLPGYGLGSRDTSFDGQSIWTLHDGTKRDDNSIVSIFLYDSLQPSNLFVGSRDKKLILGFAKNHLKKLRSLRHPDILKFIDGTETDTAVYIVTEKVESLATRLESREKSPAGSEVEWKIWGLSRIVSALKFLNGPGASTHGNLRPSSIFISHSGEWRLSGFEILSSPKDPQPILYTLGGLLPDSSRYASPEVIKAGYDALKDLDPYCLDSFQLYLLVQTVFNNVPPSSDSVSQPRGSIPPQLFSTVRRLASANPKSRLKSEALWEIGFGSGESGGGVAGGFFRQNRLITICSGLEGFSLASQGERASLVKSIKDCADSLPSEFLKFKVLPSLVQSFDHSLDGPALLPLAIAISSSLSQTEFANVLLQPLVKLFISPDRAIRLSLLELLPQYVEKLDKSIVVDKIWPHLLTGFSDTVPLIREATVKSVLLIAPKLSERILNNDLLRYLAKTHMDVEPGIRTNTCILLGRLSKSLSLSTCRKVLIPAFTRSIRDQFVPARMAGLMSLMATVDYYEAEDLATKVIPGIGIALVDKEKTVRDQAFKALDIFVERVRKAASEMPETVASTLSVSESVNNAISNSQPGIAMSAAGAAGALAGWAFSSVSRKLTSNELSSDIASGKFSAEPSNGASSKPHLSSPDLSSSLAPPPNLSRMNSATLTKAFTFEDDTQSKAFTELSDKGAGKSWGDDLMDVEADADDWSTFETGPPTHEPSFTPLPSKIKIGLQSNIQNSNKSRVVGGAKADRSIGKGPKKVGAAATLMATLEADNELEDSVEGAVKDQSIDQMGWGDFNANEDNNEGKVKSNLKSSVSVSSKEDKAAQMAKMKEERRAKMAALKAKKAGVGGG